ncbi:cell wall elongation regulator TseB-like domain-containing protein [Streptococcus equinus]|uniref:cell wall elongation regulator TseB-like domain-containing protein n=1 Tax=Streptococcus equinus TaxID=1335 RepID=UPI00088D56C0|nr:DUF5590 domain-containing protein [Streptococcus equinus]SDQ24734.1 Uncharacterized protein YpmB [Streptococcus equinus]SEN66403.1 Uncharacterized protein YpmB [Streptococcus equinus]
MKKLTPVKQYLLGFSLILLVLLISAATVLFLAMKPRLSAEKVATQVAIDTADLVQTSSVDLYNGSKTYYSVYGTTASGEQKIVSVGEDNGKVFVYSVSDGISRKEAEQVAAANGATGISKVVYGIDGKTPIWEVTATDGYYLVNFETSELVKKEGI